MTQYRLNLFIQPEHAKRLDELAATAASQPALSGGLTQVLAQLRALDAAALDACADAVLDENGDNLNPMHAPFVAAALQILWSVSASSVKFNACLSQKLRCDRSLSGLTPTMRKPLRASSSRPSRRLWASSVHPEVLSLG